MNPRKRKYLKLMAAQKAAPAPEPVVEVAPPAPAPEPEPVVEAAPPAPAPEPEPVAVKEVVEKPARKTRSRRKSSKSKKD